jgi:hypothetical protein
MLETNIRIVEPGVNLCFNARVAQIVTQDLSPDLLQKACGALRKRHALAAVVNSDGESLLVAAKGPVPNVVVQDEDWRLEVNDSGRTYQLRFADRRDRPLLTQLLERALTTCLEQHTRLWNLVGYRIWYEPAPFRTVEDVAAYQRFEISSINIDDVGVGIVVDISTAFFTVWTVADFFKESLPKVEMERRRERFEYLGARKSGRKGTLLYDFGKNQYRCYFDSFCPGVTTATTGMIRLQGQNYESLRDYYQLKHGVSIGSDEPVAKVSFPRIDRAQPVWARALRLRVSNESLPNDLKNVDKVAPKDRCAEIEKFWTRLADRPFGEGCPKVESSFWRPSNNKRMVLKCPDLTFAKGRMIQAPLNGHVDDHRAYYRERNELLNEVGCLRVPPALTRGLHVAVPEKAGEAMANQLADNVTERLSKWTRVEIVPEVVSYKTVDEALTQLRRETNPGIVLFVFEDEDPAMYYNLAYELKDWRIKRITYANLKRFGNRFQFSANGHNGSSRRTVATCVPKGWKSFVEMNSLDLLQQMDCIPWSIASSVHYESQLVIDVGEDRRNFALSLLICRPASSEPSFRIDTVVPFKSDPKHETINEVVLHDEILKLCKRAVIAGFKHVRSMLVLRDGHECGREMDAIHNAQAKLIESGFFEKDARLDTVDVHKKSVKGIRLWDRDQSGKIQHCLEGTPLLLDARTVVLVNTGAATLPEGRTAEPMMIVARGDGNDMKAVTEYVHATTQLNWSSPRVAQKLPLPLKRTDDELKNRAAQEIRRTK